jgi:hypothetical protein
MKKPVLLFFQEVLPGDIKKQQTKSNVAISGGGARDLRMPNPFGTKIAPMFPSATNVPGVKSGTVHWESPAGEESHRTIELWRSTTVRPKETRVARTNKIDGWDVNATEFQKAHAQGQKWFYLLVRDADGNVWARLIEEKNLDGETPKVRDFIKKRMQETPKTHAVRGVMDFEKDEVFPK